MQIDANDLAAFYATGLGTVARRLLAHRIRARWRHCTGLTVFGLGFASPYLGSFQGEAQRLGALMPGEQGALVWPRAAPHRTVMVDEAALPLPDQSVDRLLLVHSLELSSVPARVLLREAWRVLAPEGRIIIIVANRRGWWARRDATPFGHGQPYSRGQMERLLSETLFSPIDWATALHLPPVDRRFLLRWATVFERFGSRLWPAFSGVLMVEARKELGAPLIDSVAVRRSRAPLTPALAPSAPASITRDPSDDATLKPAQMPS